jgi:serine/threonine protein kinase
MKLELKALTDLCRNINVDANGVVEARQTTLSHCNRCCKGSEFECIEGGIWVAKCDITEPTSPDGARKLNAPLSASLFSILTVQASATATADGQCIVMEYMRWGSLQDQINANHKFTEEELAVIAFSILSALVYIDAHKYIHRDIKVGDTLFFFSSFSMLHVTLSSIHSQETSSWTPRVTSSCLTLDPPARTTRRSPRHRRPLATRRW